MGEYNGRPGVDWGAVAQAVGVDAHLQAQEEARKVAAVRWQGQQDYQTLVGSGVDPSEALRRTAHMLYFGMSGAGMAAAVRQPKQGTIENINGRDFFRNPNGSLSAVPAAVRQMTAPVPMEVGGQKGWTDEKGIWRPFRKEAPDPTAFVNVSEPIGPPENKVRANFKTPRAQYIEAKDANAATAAITKMAPEQAKFNAAKARVDAGHTGWFGGNLSDMLGSSNTLVQAGIDPNTAKMKAPSPSEMQGPPAPAMTPPVAGTPGFTTAAEVRAAYRAGKLSKEQAAKLLESQFQFGK